MKVKQQLKKLKAAQKEYQKLMMLEQSKCPHISKKSGKSKLEPFTEDGIQKARCSKCGAVVIIDPEMLAPQSVDMSTEVIKAALAELKSQNAVGRIDLDETTLRTIYEFEANVLNDLPEFMSGAANAPEDGGSNKKHKKGKKHGKKKNKNKKKEFKKGHRW